MLMGSSQIVDLAIQTLKKAMPTPPKSVSELKEIQSRISRAEVEQSRVEFGSNRARPKLPEDKNYVGKL